MLAIVSPNGLDVTSIIRMSGVEPMAELTRTIEPNFEFVSADAHYDGVYYYAIVLDPLATAEAHELIDLAAYRYSHVGYGWAAWLASLGNPAFAPIGLLFVGIVSIGGAAAIASVISRQLGWSPWGGLLVALNPGLVYSVSSDTGEPFAALLLGLLLLALGKRRWLWVGILMVALCLTKEIFLVVGAGLFVWVWLDAWRTKGDYDLFAPLAAICAGPIAWILWNAYLYQAFDLFALSEAPKSLYLPLEGWAQSLTIAAGLSLSTQDSQQVGQIAVPLIVVVGALLIVGMYYSRRLRTEIEAAYLFLAAFTLCLGPLQVVYPKDLLRLTSMPLILLPALLRKRPVEPASRVEGDALGESDEDRRL